MDPFSLAVGVLGITGFALSAIKHLHSTIDALTEAQRELTPLREGLSNVARTLKALETVLSNSALSRATTKDLEEAGLAAAVNACGTACNELAEYLTQRVVRTSGGKLGHRILLVIRISRSRSIQALKDKLQSCQAVTQIALDTAQLLIVIRTEAMLSDQKSRNALMRPSTGPDTSNTSLARERQRRRDDQPQVSARGQTSVALSSDGSGRRASGTHRSASQNKDRAFVHEISRNDVKQSFQDVDVDESSSGVVASTEAGIGKVEQTWGNVWAKQGSNLIIGTHAKTLELGKFFERQNRPEA